MAHGVNNGREHPWTREELIEAGVEWADRFEAPPVRREWDVTLLRRAIKRAKAKVEQLEEIERTWQEGDYPGVSPVIRVFGSWPAFIKALGFTPHVSGRPTDETRAWHREQARELRELGPVHLRVLDLLKRGAPIEHTELRRLYLTRNGGTGGEDELRAGLGELVATGLVAHALVIKHVYTLTAKGRRELDARRTPQQRDYDRSNALRDARPTPVRTRRPA